jgi:hypothetical protein
MELIENKIKCAGQCKNYFKKTELVNGLCIFCEPIKIDFTNFDTALADLHATIKKINVPISAPELPVNLNTRIKCVLKQAHESITNNNNLLDRIELLINDLEKVN